MYSNDAGVDGERLLNYKFFEKQTEFNHRQLKGAMTSLRSSGIAEHLPAVSYEDGMPSGSGFKLTQKGHNLAQTFPEIKQGIEDGEYE